MAKIATRGKKLSGVLAFEEMADKGVCRKVATVTIVAGMDLGAVLQFDGTSKYKWVANADVATLNADVAVLIDTVVDVSTLTPGDYQLVILHKGHSGVTDKGLLYKDAVSNANQAIVHTALRAKNIHVRAQV